jgi:hypothetical protein
MSEQKPDQPKKLVVPGRPLRTSSIETDEEFEGLVKPQDLGSASRSCLAILIVIALLLCVFLIGTTFFR